MIHKLCVRRHFRYRRDAEGADDICVPDGRYLNEWGVISFLQQSYNQRQTASPSALSSIFSGWIVFTYCEYL